MNAAKRANSSRPSPISQTLPPVVPSQRRAYYTKRRLHVGARRAAAMEISVKLTVNLVLAVIAGTTIAKLVPYYQSQQSRLEVLQASVQLSEQENTKLWASFSRSFDPAQAGQIMQEQSGRESPNQRPVIWLKPAAEE